MKKFTVLAVLALMVAVAMPVMATDFTWSGELTYGGITDFTNVLDNYGNAKLAVAGKVDDFNTINARLQTAYKGSAKITLTDATGSTGDINAFSVYLDRFNMVTDLGKALGLSGISVVSTIGWANPTGTSYSLTDIGDEGIIGYDHGARDNFSFVVGVGSAVNVLVDFYNLTHSTAAVAFNPNIMVNVYGAVGPVSYSVIYDANNSYPGQAGASATFSQAFGDITPSVNAEFNYDLVASTFEYGAAVKVAYKSLVTAAAGILGGGTSLTALDANVNVVPMANLGIDLDAKFDMATAGNYGVDASVWYKFGAAKARLGYVLTNDGFKQNAPAALTDGGLYLSYDLSF